VRDNSESNLIKWSIYSCKNRPRRQHISSPVEGVRHRREEMGNLYTALQGPFPCRDSQ